MLALVLAVAAMVAPALQTPLESGWSAFPFDGFVPENGKGVHDPSICEIGGVYLCLCTNGGGFGTLRTSPDLIHWKVEGPLMDTPKWLEAAIPQHRSVWAPEAIPVGHGLRCYYCASAAFGRNDSWIGMADCPNFDPANPLKGWQDHGPLIQSQEGKDNFNAIDPSVLRCDDGQEFMVFGSYWSGIYMLELDPATGLLKHPDRSDMKLIAKNPRDRANGIEAPCAFQRGGFTYLVVNYGLAAQGVRSTYELVVGRSKSPTGPFTDSHGVDMVEGGHEPLLSSSSPMFGPGGGNVIQDSAGRWLLSHHYYDGRAPWHGHVWGLPTLCVRELDWTADGWPVPGLPVTPQTSALTLHPAHDLKGTWLIQADFAQVRKIELKANGEIDEAGAIHGSWKRQGRSLRLEWDNHAVDDMNLANGDHFAVGRNSAGMVVRAIQESAVR